MPPSGTANIIKRKKTEDEKMIYPLDVETTGHFMMFLPKQYEYTGGKVGFRQIKERTKAIVLPLPKNLSENYSANWETESIGAIGSNVAAAITEGDTSFNGIRDTILNTITEGLISTGAKSVESNSSAAAGGIGAAALGAGKFGSIISAALASGASAAATGAKLGFGLAANPYLAMLFHGVNLRTHNFTFDFFAKSPAESIKIKKITDRFRYSMLPGYNTALKGSGRALFNYPDIFHIAFMQNDYLFSFKPCALSNMNINYHQQGDAFYFDLNGKKVPAAIQIQLEFRELEIIIKDDFESENVIKSESNFNNALISRDGR